jgi:oxaloacetate decarboxylase alpha subunit
MIRRILGDEQPITGRPADRLTPVLPKATDGVDPKLIEHEEDILSYLLLPEPAVEYFKWRVLPPAERPETPADLELKKLRQDIKPEATPPSQPLSPFASEIESLINTAPTLVQQLLRRIDGLSLDEVVFKKGDQRITVRAAETSVPSASVTVAVSDNDKAPQPGEGVKASSPVPAKTQATPAQQEPKKAEVYKRTINAPLVGKFYMSPGQGKTAFVNEGDTVNAGDKVCIVEAMKLFNEITAPVKCRIVKILVQEGVTVQKEQPLVAIEEV